MAGSEIIAGALVTAEERMVLEALVERNASAGMIGDYMSKRPRRGWKALRILTSLEERRLVLHYEIAVGEKSCVLWQLTPDCRREIGAPDVPA